MPAALFAARLSALYMVYLNLGQLAVMSLIPDEFSPFRLCTADAGVSLAPADSLMHAASMRAQAVVVQKLTWPSPCRAEMSDVVRKKIK
jgi:hypothetical protein